MSTWIAYHNTTALTAIKATSLPNHKPTATATATATITLKALTKSGQLEPALRLIESQPSKPLDPTVCSLLLHACISQRSLQHGRRLYLHLITTNRCLLNAPAVKAKLITLFSLCGLLDEAWRVFLLHDDGLVPESVWVAMAIGCCKNGLPQQALALYSEMLSRFVSPGSFSFSMALKAATEVCDLRVGRAVHAQIVKCEEETDQVVDNALLALYVRCGCFDNVLPVFEKMPRRNVVSWNSLISNFSGRDRVFDALHVFRRMQNEGIVFSWVTLTSVLAVCARATALVCGKEVHAQMVKSSMRPDIPVLNSLLDMYAKCGETKYCKRVFDGMQFKDLTSWNTMLTGYALNGFMEEMMELFDAMGNNDIKPDGVTFVALLSGCSHAGDTNEGQRLFNSMKSRYDVSPTIEHYACLVDVLGRAGRIKEALEVVESMPMRPSSCIWGSLLNSCRLHRNVSLGELVAKHLFELEPNNPGNYVMLSNIYANLGMWEDVKRIRETMEQMGIKKVAGCSWIQIRNIVHTFVAGGSFELRNSDEFEKASSELSEALKEDGYRPNTSVVLHDVNEETKASWVCGHSERLATVFALFNTSKNGTIRVTKNLRVCLDCHSWMKHVSKVTERVIVLRDTNRFHHFKDGMCSCKDYW